MLNLDGIRSSEWLAVETTYVTSMQYTDFLSSVIVLFGPNVSEWPAGLRGLYFSFVVDKDRVESKRTYGLFGLWGVDVSSLAVGNKELRDD
jgi:hypothetical protein